MSYREEWVRYMNMPENAVSSLTDRHYSIIDALAKMRFATIENLTRYFSFSQPAQVSRPLNQLVELGMVEAHRELRPHCFRLSQSACRRLRLEYHRRWHSFSAIQKYCLANDVEMDLKEKYGEVKRINRRSLEKVALVRAHDEHVFIHTKSEKWFLAVIDDYLMDSGRIKHVLNRQHLKKKGEIRPEYKKWGDFVDVLQVITTDKKQEKRHQKYVEKNNMDNVVVQFKKAPWGLS